VTASASWRALGTTASVLVARDAGLPAARAAVEHELDEIDRACSRFRVDSELNRVNGARGSWTEAGPLLIEAVLTALRAARLTAGAVDPTIGASLIAAGYDRDFDAIRSSRRRLRIVRAPGWRVVEVDPVGGRVRVPAGIVLDLGATAKALAADRAAPAAARATGAGVLVNLGGDLAVAGPAPAAGWAVRVTDDHRAPPTAPGETVIVRSGALATSSTTVRRWRRGGASVHHVLDPATGAPVAGPWQTVSVTAATCVDANTAATAALVLGAEAVAWLEGLELPARLCHHDGTVTRIAGWPVAAEESSVA
jgi:thiamine biosynthesis lipoprotein